MAAKRPKTSVKIAKKSATSRVDAKASRRRKVAPKSPFRRGVQVALLAGGNPQIAKADGDAPVQAYIAAMPGWKRAVGRRLDALIVRTVPGVRKAVKWNSPFYGIDDGIDARGLVPQFPLLHDLRQSGFLPRRIAAPSSPGRVESKRCALPRHPRGRSARREAHCELDSPGVGAARVGPVAARSQN